MNAGKSARRTERIEIKGQLDPHAAAAMQLEIRRLAEQHGIDIVEFRCEKESV
jgi:type IV pilus biogenesis protein CpaD/CtpE